MDSEIGYIFAIVIVLFLLSDTLARFTPEESCLEGCCPKHVPKQRPFVPNVCERCKHSNCQ